jgi:hypothetical protein
MTWDERIFWPAFEQAGMLVDATVAMTGCPQELPVKVLLTRPDVQLVDGALSTDWMIEYQVGDLPTLAEGDELVISDTLYRVRQAPTVDDGANSGYFRRALLTRV